MTVFNDGTVTLLRTKDEPRSAATRPHGGAPHLFHFDGDATQIIPILGKVKTPVRLGPRRISEIDERANNGRPVSPPLHHRRLSQTQVTPPVIRHAASRSFHPDRISYIVAQCVLQLVTRCIYCTCVQPANHPNNFMCSLYLSVGTHTAKSAPKNRADAAEVLGASVILQECAEHRKWTPRDSADLYNLPGWGAPYFDASCQGHLICKPHGKGEKVNSVKPKLAVPASWPCADLRNSNAMWTC